MLLDSGEKLKVSIISPMMLIMQVSAIPALASDGMTRFQRDLHSSQSSTWSGG
jgi:hypothetical protein